jgi:HAD superfamily hydrolase (TIGR01509 family)
MDLKAVLFDVDGTLSHTEDAHMAAFNEAFRAEGLDWRWDRDLYGRLLSVAGGRERIRHYIDTENLNIGLRGQKKDDWIARLHADKTRRFGDMVSGGKLKLRSGVARLIRESLGHGLRLAIVTTTSRINVDKLLAHAVDPAPAADTFEVFATGECAANKKPAPDVYRWALQHLALVPEACIAIEDSTNGLRAALGAGVPAVITTSPYTRGYDFTGATAIIDRLGEPDRPFRLLHGDGMGKTCVDVELLRHWREQHA